MSNVKRDLSAVGTGPLVIGVGARFRGDDEAGLLVVEALQEVGRRADFALHSDDPARLMNDWAERSHVLVVDAVRTERPNVTVDEVLDAIDRCDHDASAESYWTLDPVDGTKGFLRGQQYAIALARIDGGNAY